MFPKQPRIINRMQQALSPDAEAIFATMFSDCQEIIVRSEFQSGLSSSHVFLVRPIKADGAELPTVVKIDRTDLIQREWISYQRCIQNRLPGIAKVRSEPVCLPKGNKSGLCYPLIGEDTFDIESLYQYYGHANIQDICHVLVSRLFKSLGTLWTQTLRPQAELHLQTFYDSFLPVNLVIELAKPIENKQPHLLQPDTVTMQTYAVDDYVQLSDFRIVNIVHQSHQLSLDMPSDVQAAYRIHIYPVPNIERYKLGDVIRQPFIGIVRKTRQDLLQEQAKMALGSSVDIMQETLTLANNVTLPNPLVQLPHILNQTFDAHTAYIHGDLNLQNILIEPENRNAYLIDFAKSRRDHVLRDLLHLEMAVVTQLLPLALAETKRTTTYIISFYEQLHTAVQHSGQVRPPTGLEKPFAILKIVRRTAQHYLFVPNNWEEYFYSLVIYLLGALRYSSLNTVPGAKATAFWGAAATLKLLAASSAVSTQSSEKADSIYQNTREREEKIVDNSSPDRSSLDRNQTEANFYEPIPGLIYIVSSDAIHTHKLGQHNTNQENDRAESTHENIIAQGQGTNKIKTQNTDSRFEIKERGLLRQVLMDCFSKSDLQNICFDLKVDYENLSGDSKSDKARELIIHLERRGRLAELIKLGRQHCPQAPWTDILMTP